MSAPNYETIAVDCEIIEQKIASLRKALMGDKSAKGQLVEHELWRALNAIQAAKLEAK